MYCMLGILYHLIYTDLEWFNIFFLFDTVEKCEQYNSDFDSFLALPLLLHEHYWDNDFIDYFIPICPDPVTVSLH